MLEAQATSLFRLAGMYRNQVELAKILPAENIEAAYLQCRKQQEKDAERIANSIFKGIVDSLSK